MSLKFETDLEQNPDKFSFTPPGPVVEQSLGNDVTTAHTNLRTLCGNDDAFVTRVSQLANSHLLDEGVQLGKTQMETQLGGGTLGDPTSLPGRPSKEVHLEQMQDGSVKITLKNVTAFSKLSGGGVDVPLDPEKNYVRDKVTIILSPDPNVPPQFSTSTAIHTELPDGFQMGVGGPVDLGENIDQVTALAIQGNRRGPVEKALSDVLKTPELLEEFPTGEDVPEYVSELTSHRELLQARLQSLEAHGDTDSGVGRLAKSLKSEIREQIRQIDNHISYVQRASGGNATSRARLSNQVYMAAKGMSLYLGALYSARLKGGADASTLQRIEQLRKEMEDRGAQQLNVERGNVAPVTNPKREVERMVAPIKRRFEQGLKELGLKIPEDELQTCFFNYALGRQQKWEKYSKGVILFGQQFTSTITPASKQEHLREDYGDLEGAPSGDKFESTHATALAHTEFFDSHGEKLFEAERSGVLCAWGIEDEDARRVANKNRALEVVKSAFTNDPNLLQRALLNPDQPVNLTISSLSLLTPDIFRGRRWERETHAAGTSSSLGGCLRDSDLSNPKSRERAMGERERQRPAGGVQFWSQSGRRLRLWSYQQRWLHGRIQHARLGNGRRNESARPRDAARPEPRPHNRPWRNRRTGNFTASERKCAGATESDPSQDAIRSNPNDVAG